ncbi:MAG: hypothetical protein JNJ55_00070 [Betaproteobacteria bacterium]|nr:hypothetical protein [Betaproteobacteria bacterium]
MSRLPGNGEELLAEIYRGGFVEVVSGDAPAPRAEVAASPGAAPVAFDLKTTQRAAVHAVEELFGPEGESIALKIERASTQADLMAILERTRDLIRGTRGEARAAKFWTGIFK